MIIVVFFDGNKHLYKNLNVVPIKVKKWRKQQPNVPISLIMRYLPNQLMVLISNTATRKISYHTTETCTWGGGRKGKDKNRWRKIWRREFEHYITQIINSCSWTSCIDWPANRAWHGKRSWYSNGFYPLLHCWTWPRASWSRWLNLLLLLLLLLPVRGQRIGRVTSRLRHLHTSVPIYNHHSSDILVYVPFPL